MIGCCLSKVVEFHTDILSVFSEDTLFLLLTHHCVATGPMVTVIIASLVRIVGIIAVHSKSLVLIQTFLDKSLYER